MSFKTSLGFLKFLAVDLNGHCAGFNITELLLEPFMQDGKQFVRVHCDGLPPKEYDVRQIDGVLPLSDVQYTWEQLEGWNKEMDLRVERNVLSAQNRELRQALEGIITMKNDGAVQFYDEEKFQCFLKVYRDAKEEEVVDG